MRTQSRCYVTVIAIADGLRGRRVFVGAVDQADACVVDRADRVVVGGPSHAHGLRHTSSGESARSVTPRGRVEACGGVTAVVGRQV